MPGNNDPDKGEPEEKEEEEGSETGAHDGKFAEIMVEESDFILFNKTKLVPHGTMDDVYIL